MMYWRSSDPRWCALSFLHLVRIFSRLNISITSSSRSDFRFKLTFSAWLPSSIALRREISAADESDIRVSLLLARSLRRCRACALVSEPKDERPEGTEQSDVPESLDSDGMVEQVPDSDPGDATDPSDVRGVVVPPLHGRATADPGG
jgi:hypothetical protein